MRAAHARARGEKIIAEPKKYICRFSLYVCAVFYYASNKFT